MAEWDLRIRIIQLNDGAVRLDRFLVLDLEHDSEVVLDQADVSLGKAMECLREKLAAEMGDLI